MSSVVIPPIMTSQGATPTPPATLNSNLIALVASEVPDYTATLPGTLIEDLSSTCTLALVTQDQARVDQINNLSPLGINPALLNQLGLMFGIQQGIGSNTSVYVVFTGPAGYVIPAGFVVSDGTYQYVVQDGGVIGTSGQSAQLFAVANQSGSWAVAEGTVTILVTSVPSGYTLTVTNPSTGVAGGPAQTVQSYRSQVLASWQIGGQGYSQYLQSLLEMVPGVVPRLIKILQVSNGWEILVGGGDPYLVGGAIYLGTLDLSTLQGSSTTSLNVTVSIVSPPDSYIVIFVNPEQITVTGTITWNTSSANFTSGTQVNQLAQVALTNYINSIHASDPINLLEMENIFQTAVSSVLPSNLLTSLSFSISLNGTVTPPNAGTSIIPPTIPESYFFANVTGLSVVQG